MYVICPMSQCASPEKRDRFTGLLSSIGRTTLQNETDVLAYAWFRSAGDNDTVPHHFVRGFEVYRTLSASTETHRASPEYKAMRQAAGAEGLLAGPSDLRYLEPLNLGFLSRASLIIQDSPNTGGYVVIEILRPISGKRQALLQIIEGLAHEVKDAQKATTSFWPLGYREEHNDEAILIFERFGSKTAYEQGFLASANIQAFRSQITAMCESEERTTWVDANIGFIGR